MSHSTHNSHLSLPTPAQPTASRLTFGGSYAELVKVLDVVFKRQIERLSAGAELLVWLGLYAGVLIIVTVVAAFLQRS